MTRGRKPVPRPDAQRDSTLNALPRCPDHLLPAARKEWRRLATPMFNAGILTVADRAALAAYCQAWARWVEAEEKLQTTAALIKTPAGHVRQSPLISIANKQLELMGKYMAELGLTPAARTRLDLPTPAGANAHTPARIERIIIAAADVESEALPEASTGNNTEAP